MSEPKRAIWNTYAQAWKEAAKDRKLAALRDSTVSACVYPPERAGVDSAGSLVTAGPSRGEHAR